MPVRIDRQPMRQHIVRAVNGNAIALPSSSSMLTTLGAMLADAQAARDAAVAVGNSNDTIIAGRINTPGSATLTALIASFAGKWKANTAYAAGDTVLAPDGSLVKAKTAFTSAASYNATNWTSVATTAGTQAATELDARFARGINLESWPGVDPTGVAECATAIQAAIDAAAAAGLRAYARGTFKISSTITINADVDLGEATFNYSGGASTAVLVGSATTPLRRRRNIRLPRIVNTAKATNGWAAVAGSIGLKLLNCYSCEVTVPHVTGFDIGMLVCGANGQGTAYTDIHMGHLDNNQVNFKLGVDEATGFANQNNIFGGRLSHNSNEGTVVVGTRHVLIASAANIVNGNTFHGTSLESPNVVEYHLDCYGNDNYLIGCRWENTGAPPRVYWRGLSKGNVILGGFNADQIVETRLPNSQNEIHNRVIRRYLGGDNAHPTVVLENPNSSTAPYLQAMTAGGWAAGDDESTQWLWRFTGSQLSGKQRTDTEDRLRLDFTNGRLYAGPGGATAPVVYLSGGTGGLVVNGGNLYMDNDNTRDIGSTSSLRPRYVRVGTAVVTGSAATASRPNAVTAGVGAMFYDSTLKKPIWSDGTTWRDSAGTAV